MSVPIILADGTVIAASRDWLMRVDPIAGRVLWKSRKPDAGNPISPVLIGTASTMVLVSTTVDNGGGGGPAEVSVWDVAAGTLLWHQSLRDASNGRTYQTKNTVPVSGSRAYVSTEALEDQSDGRLYALDVCESAACGGRGALNVAWHYDFTGPSGASPLVIGSRVFLDGRSALRQGVLLAVDDLGASARMAWRKTTPEPSNVSPAQDPRGGMWVNAYKSFTLVRMDTNTGATLQQVDLSAVLGLPASYVTASALTLSRDSTGGVVLTIGVVSLSDNTAPTYLASVDVSSTPGGLRRWLYRVAPNLKTNAALGQFPVVISPTGARRVVFQGKVSGTVFVGDP
jgi:hypothetical protein